MNQNMIGLFINVRITGVNFQLRKDFVIGLRAKQINIHVYWDACVYGYSSASYSTGLESLFFIISTDTCKSIGTQSILYYHVSTIH